MVEQREDINELFQMADCFVSCSDFETFSYAICEATLAFMPVIQSDIRGTLWNAENPSTILFKKGSVDSLEEAMQRYMHSDAKKMQQNCRITRDRNLRKYSLDAWCNRIMSFYENL